MSDVRTNHGDLMDGVYRYQRHFYDATRKYYLLGRDRMIRNLRPPQEGTVLEIGCGTGRNLITVGKTYRDAKLYGFDISSQMLVSAKNSTARYLPNHKVALVRGDATDFNSSKLFDIASFDRVYISYSLSMIPDWEKALDLAYASLSPSGQLHIIDFGNQGGLPSIFRVCFHKWLALFHVTPRKNLEQTLESLAKRNGATLAFRSLFRGYTSIAIITRNQSND